MLNKKTGKYEVKKILKPNNSFTAPKSLFGDDQPVLFIEEALE